MQPSKTSFLLTINILSMRIMHLLFPALLLAGACNYEKLELSGGSGSGNFPKRYGGAAKSDKAFGIIKTSDGNFVIVGETESFGNGKTDVILLKIDEDGEQVWSNQKTFGMADEDAGYAVCEKTNGDLMIAGVVNRTSDTMQGGFFIQTMSDGTTRYAVEYDQIISGSKQITELHDVVEGNDNKPVFAGSIDLCGPGCFHLWFPKAELNGQNPQSDGYGSGQDTYGKACTKTSAGYFACGVQFSNNTTQNDIYFVRRAMEDFVTDNTVSAKNFPEAGNQFAYDVIPGSPTSIIAVGWSDNNSSGSSDILFLELETDVTMSIIIKKLIGGPDAEKANAILAVNGGYVITGEVTNSSGNTDLLLMKVDTNGNLIWSKKFGGAFIDIGYGVAATSDGGYMVAGYTQFGATAAETDIYVIRTDKDGNLK